MPDQCMNNDSDRNQPIQQRFMETQKHQGPHKIAGDPQKMLDELWPTGPWPITDSQHIPNSQHPSTPVPDFGAGNMTTAVPKVNRRETDYTLQQVFLESALAQQPPPVGQPFYKRGKLYLWLLAALLVFALIIIIGAPFKFIQIGLTSSILPAHIFHISSIPNISVITSEGTIRVRTGPTNTVSITAITQTSFLSGNPSIDYASGQGNTINVNVRDSGLRLIGNNRVDFDIMVPPSTNLDLFTKKGSINVKGVTGQAALHCQTGQITVTQTTLTNKGSVVTDSGIINFNGKLAKNAFYTIKNKVGQTSVTLPANSQTLIDAATKFGSIKSEFRQLAIRQSKDEGSEAHGELGASYTSSTLILSMEAGNIEFHRRKV